MPVCVRLIPFHHSSSSTDSYTRESWNKMMVNVCVCVCVCKYVCVYAGDILALHEIGNSLDIVRGSNLRQNSGQRVCL
jgi:hypothetical protein